MRSIRLSLACLLTSASRSKHIKYIKLASAVALVAIAVNIFDTDRSCRAEEFSEEARESLKDAWKFQQNVFEDAQLSLGYFFVMGNHSKTLSRDDLWRVSEEMAHRLRTGAEFARVEEVAKQLNVPRGFGGWKTLDVTVSGGKCKNVRCEDGEPDFIVSYDGNYGVTRRPQNGQSDVYLGRSPFWTVTDKTLRFIMSPSAVEHLSDPVWKDNLHIVARFNRSPGYSLEVDTATGFVYEFNRPNQVSWQFIPRKYKSGILWPQVTTLIRLSKGTTRSVKIFYVRSAVFNTGIQDGAFKVAIDQGETLVDHTVENGRALRTLGANESAVAALKEVKEDLARRRRQ